MEGWQRGGSLLVVGLCLAGCLAAPTSAAGGDGGDDPGDGDGGAIGGDGGTGGVDAAPPICGDGTGLALAHVSEVSIPPVADGFELDGLAVFMNTGTTTIHTGQLKIIDVSTIGCATFDLAISGAGKELPPGESHGYLDATSRPLMMELVEGLWSDQARPDVFGSISTSVTSGTFQADITYELGEYQAAVDITFVVEGAANGSTGGRRIAAACAE